MTTANFIRRLGICAAAVVAIHAPASAELPEPVRAMIGAAIATGDKNKVAAVVEAAKATNPDDLDQIDAMHEVFRAEQRELAAAKAAEEREAIRRAGLFDSWDGEGQVGGSRSSGNNDSIGITAALNLQREGIDWTHRLRARLDYQRNNNVTSREQYFAAYEPRFQINPGLFTYALAQYEKDRFQGLSSRYAVSGGFGYRVVDTPTMQLSVKAGPAWRRTHFTSGLSESSLAALAALDFEWQLADTLSLTQSTDLVTNGTGSAVAIIDRNNTSLNLVTGLEADLIDSLAARLSYAVDYDSNPPAGAVSTDTLTRFTLIYGF